MAVAVMLTQPRRKRPQKAQEISEGEKPARKRAKKNTDKKFNASLKVTHSVPMSRRPRRSAARKAMNRLQDLGEIEGSYSQPSASHYVGYVEEGETVDMIMKKKISKAWRR